MSLDRRTLQHMGWKGIVIVLAVITAVLAVGTFVYFSATAGDATGIEKIG